MKILNKVIGLFLLVFSFAYYEAAPLQRGHHDGPSRHSNHGPKSHHSRGYGHHRGPVRHYYEPRHYHHRPERPYRYSHHRKYRNHYVSPRPVVVIRL